MTWTHIELQERLAAALRMRTPRPMVYTEVAIDGAWGDAGRLDVVTALIGSRYSGVTVDGYECKANRADWLRDHAADKWSRYLPMLDRLYLAVPSGANVITAATEVPKPLGVITLDTYGRLRIIRKADKLSPPHDRTGVWLRLLRRSDAMLTEAMRPRADRLDRMQKLAHAQEAQQLAALLSRRFREAQAELAARTRDIGWEIRSLENRRDTLRAELEQLGDVPSVLDAATRVLHELVAATRPLHSGGHFDRNRRDAARAKLVELAAALEPDR